MSGFQYADDLTGGAASRVIARLKPGARLELVPEPTNPHNPRAIQIVSRRTQLGWLPDYLVDEAHGYLAAGRRVELIVERANGPHTPSHVRLQCRLIVGPSVAPHRSDA